MTEKTLRDEFAMAAMQGNWAAQTPLVIGEAEISLESLIEEALVYYRMADAMIIARSAIVKDQKEKTP